MTMSIFKAKYYIANNPFCDKKECKVICTTCTTYKFLKKSIEDKDIRQALDGIPLLDVKNVIETTGIGIRKKNKIRISNILQYRKNIGWVVQLKPPIFADFIKCPNLIIEKGYQSGDWVCTLESRLYVIVDKITDYIEIEQIQLASNLFTEVFIFVSKQLQILQA